MALLDLPRDEEALVEALDKELGAAEMECNLWKTSWKIIDAYLEGMRCFRVEDRFSGTIEIDFEKIDGHLGMRYEQVLKAYLTEAGRYMKMDVSPVVTRKGESLDAMRRGAIGHAVLGSMIQPMALARIKTDAIKPFLKYGTVGLEHWETGDPNVPDDVEVVNPWELRGLRAFTQGTQNIYATCRVRKVPLTWLKKKLKERFGKDFRYSETDLRPEDVAWGTSIPGEGETLTAGGVSSPVSFFKENKPTQTAHGDMGPGKKKKREDNDLVQVFVPLEEVYVQADNPAYLGRYIIKIGDKICYDRNFEEERRLVLPPLRVARHTDIGRFYGRGFVSPLIPMNDHLERMLGSLFKNIIDLDTYGTVLVPSSWGIQRDSWKAGRRPKVETYEPDYAAPNAKLQAVQPVTSGTLPKVGFESGMAAMDLLTGQGPMFAGGAAGRVDSASGHGFLFDVANISLAMPSHSLADGFVGMWAKMLERARARVDEGKTKAVKLATIDDAVAGVVIDPETGELSMESNSVPKPWDVTIDVKDRTPRDLQTRKQQLLELLQLQVVSPTQFWITVFEENLDFPGAPKELWETYRKALWQIIVLFGDGETPGTIKAGLYSGDPKVQLLPVQRFMNKIEYSLASEEVRAAFEEWKQTLEQMTGAKFPDGLMPPDQSAVQQQQMMRAQSRPM